MKTITPARLPTPSASRPWYAHITLDLLLHLLARSVFHPFVCAVALLSLRATALPYTDARFRYTALWTLFVCVARVGAWVDHRIAWGTPRKVDWETEVVVVVGGSGGLGRLLAQVYAIRGVGVAVVDVKAPDGLDEGEESEEGWRWYRCNVEKMEDVERVWARIEQDLGSPTILYNLAARPINGQPLDTLATTTFAETLQTNFLGPLHTISLFLRHHLSPRIGASPGGTIVTVSSVLAHLSPAGLADYAASKAALSSLHRTLEHELRRSPLAASHPIKTLLVEPGQIATPLFALVDTPSRFLAPVLETRDVVREMVRRVDRGDGGVLRLPAYATWVGLVGVLPEGLMRGLRWASGVDRAVETGRLWERANGDAERRAVVTESR